VVLLRFDYRRLKRSDRGVLLGWILSPMSLLGKPLSDASLTLAPPYSCSPEKATMAW
jgi:hypothetical protein